jgi:hypothetical protein
MHLRLSRVFSSWKLSNTGGARRNTVTSGWRGRFQLQLRQARGARRKRVAGIRGRGSLAPALYLLRLAPRPLAPALSANPAETPQGAAVPGALLCDRS